MAKFMSLVDMQRIVKLPKDTLQTICGASETAAKKDGDCKQGGWSNGRQYAKEKDRSERSKGALEGTNMKFVIIFFYRSQSSNGAHRC